MLRRLTAPLQVALLCAVGQACAAHTGASHAKRFAAVPAVWVTDPPADAPDLGDAVTRPFTDAGLSVQLAPPIAAECAESAACLADVGRTAQADHTLSLRVAQLGPTTLMRLASTDVSLAAIEQTAQAVVETSDPVRLSAAATALGERVAGPYKPPVPWYRRPSMVITGAAAVVAATVLTVILVTRDGSGPDVTVRPP
jgi:hypothetical protein